MPVSTPEVKDLNSIVSNLENIFNLSENFSYKLVLQNDDSVGAEYVVENIIRILSFNYETAFEKMLIAHNFGKSILTEGDYEELSDYRDLFLQQGITVFIED